jgi:uncharacterized membrane protein YsdA (DUF1294 family)/cold shock CspA family protein
MREQGRLTEWNDGRGFGFITSLDGQARAFVHVSEFPHDSRRPEPLDLLTYEPAHDDRGRLQAKDVQFLAPVRSAHEDLGRGSVLASRPGEIPAIVPFGVLLVLLAAGVFTGGALVGVIAVAYAVMSFVTYLAYAADKAAAGSGGFRTQESALHVLELAGGWPGALVAQRRLRHKAQKRSFQMTFWACVALNLAALAFMIGQSAIVPG